MNEIGRYTKILGKEENEAQIEKIIRPHVDSSKYDETSRYLLARLIWDNISSVQHRNNEHVITKDMVNSAVSQLNYMVFQASNSNFAMRKYQTVRQKVKADHKLK